MNILETIKTQLSTEQYNELVEYIETVKEEAYNQAAEDIHSYYAD